MTTLNASDIISIYNEHRPHYDALRDSSGDLIQSLVHIHHNEVLKQKIEGQKGLKPVSYEWDEYIGLRPAGGILCL